MLIQEKKYKEYLSQEYEPVDESTNTSLWMSRRCLIWLTYAPLSSMQTAREWGLLLFLRRRSSGL